MVYTRDRSRHAVEHTRNHHQDRAGGEEGASAILDELGLSMSTAMNMFLRAVIREGGMPFEMKVNKPNE